MTKSVRCVGVISATWRRWCKKTIQPYEPRTVRLDGSRGMSRHGFPVKKLFDFWNEVEVGIHQVPHAPAVGSVGGYHLGRIHPSISDALFQKERSLLSFFHGR